MRVLILEDNALIALDLAMMVEEMGHEVLGPFYKLADAQEASISTDFDLALLDYNLGHERSTALAHALKAANRPFAMITGQSSLDLPEALSDADCLSKPVNVQMVRELLEKYEATTPN